MGLKTALASFLDFTSNPLQRFISAASETTKTASGDPLEAAKKALNKADHTWLGWTWMHDPGGETMEGPGPQANWDRWEVTRLRALALEEDQDEFEPSADLEAQAAAERAYGEACQEDAEEAQRHLDRCAQLCKRGDFEAALLEAKRAASIERKYGDDPTYGPLVKALEDVLDNLDEMSNGRTAASGRDKHLEGKKGYTLCGEKAYDDTIVESVKDATCHYCKQAWEKQHKAAALITPADLASDNEPDFSQCKTAAFNR